jgi:hypothetical protein
MVRYKVLCFLSFYAVQGFIALGTAGEGRIGHFMGECGKYLFHLLLHSIG